MRFKADLAQENLQSGKLFSWRDKARLTLNKATNEAINFCASNPFVGLDNLANSGCFVSDVDFSYMNDAQLNKLLPLLNNYCFVEALTVDELKEVFQYKRLQIPVRNVPTLAFIFGELRKANLIADGWQTTIEERQMFVSKAGKTLKAKYISRALQERESNIKDYRLMQSDKYKTLAPSYKKTLLITNEIEEIISEL